MTATDMTTTTDKTRGFNRRAERRGIIIVLTSLLLVVLFAFVAMSIDTGRIILTETEMQNAVDASAIAASQEIGVAIRAVGKGQGGAVLSVNSPAIAEARQLAVDVAEANGVFVDGAKDVYFGNRYYDEASGNWTIDWGADPINVVKVIARRTAEDTEAPDGELPLAFGWAVGRTSTPLETSATVFVESRDIVLAIDVSWSMVFDSTLRRTKLSGAEVYDLLVDMWDSLVEADPKWPDTGESKFPSTGFGKINSHEGFYVESDDVATIIEELGLLENDGERYTHLFPQSGRQADGTPNNSPSNSESYALWEDYIKYVRDTLKGENNKMYGYRTLMSYFQNTLCKWYSNDPTRHAEDFWRTPHYPFQAVKDGSKLFVELIEDLDYGDEVGIVTYGGTAEWIDSRYDGEVDIDISQDPITNNYGDLTELLHRLDAGYHGTATGRGLQQAREMLVGSDDNASDYGHSRFGARPTIVLMSDGKPWGTPPSGWTMPADFSWADWTDYDNDGNADYSATKTIYKYAFYEATEAVKRGITIHTMAVGASADDKFLEAVAHAAGGVFIDVKGGSTIDDLEEEVLEAFSEIASKTPPGQIVYENLEAAVDDQ